MSISFHYESNGYSIVSDYNNITNAVKVIVSDDGSIVASSVSLNNRLPGPDDEWLILDAKQPGHWVYSMLTGNPSTSLLEILGVPHTERADIADELFDKAKNASLKHIHSVNRDALDAMKAAPEKKLMTYNFLAIDGDRGIYRKQAAQSYPIFADILNSSLSTKMAIDRKKPLNEVLIPLLSEIAHMPLGKGFLKRFAQAPALPEGQRLSTIIRFAAHVQPDWFPKSPEEWTAFYHVAAGLLEDVEVQPEHIAELLKGSKGNWMALIERCLIKAYPDPEHPAHSSPLEYFRVATINMRDTLLSFNDMVIVPIVCHAQESDDVHLNTSIVSACQKWGWDILFNNRNLPDALEVSRHFHQKRAEIVETVQNWTVNMAKSQIEEDGWPGLTDPVQAPNGLWLVPLCSEKQLRHEGSVMRHCVGTYTTQAKSCSSHIVSVRKLQSDGTYISLSTCEFTGIKTAVPDKLSERQHRAHRNSNPTPESKDAISWYAQSITNGVLMTKWELIRAFLDDTLVVMDQVEKLCGYDWRERESLDRAISQWGPYVTKSYRSKTTDDLLDSPEASAIIDLMTPDFISDHSM